MSKPIHYTLTLLDVSPEKALVILQVLAGEGIQFRLEPIDDNRDRGHARTYRTAHPRAIQRHQHYANGVQNKGIHAHALLMELLERNGGPMHIDAIRRRFVERGFAETSASPCISQLKALGRIEYNGTTVSKL